MSGINYFAVQLWQKKGEKMKKLFLTAFLAFMLVGCSDKESSGSSVPAETTSAATTTAAASTAVTTTTAPAPKKVNKPMKFTYEIEHNVGDDSEDVLKIFDESGNQVGELFNKYYISEKIFKFEDYNFDGCDDLFFDTFYGGYYEYDPEQERFVKSERLNRYKYEYTNYNSVPRHEIKYNSSLKLKVLDERDKICVNNQAGGNLVLDDMHILQYPYYYDKLRWNDDHFETVKRNLPEIDEGGTLYLNSYDVDGLGNMFLKKRYCFDTGSRDFVETDTDLDYVCLTETSFSYIKGGKLEQSVEFGTDPEVFRKGYRGIELRDYNFDGHYDVKCYYNRKLNDVGSNYPEKCIYYLYDPEKDRYVESAALNELVDDPNKSIRTNENEKEVYYSEEIEDGYINYHYKWDNGRLKLVSRSENDRQENCSYIYGYDDDGNEYFIEKKAFTTGIAESPKPAEQIPSGTQFISYVYDDEGELYFDETYEF